MQLIWGLQSWTVTPGTIVNLVEPKVCGCNFSQLDTYILIGVLLGEIKERDGMAMIGSIPIELFNLIEINKQITNVEQSDVNLSMLALPCSRILLVQDGVYCLPCGGWDLGFLSPPFFPPLVNYKEDCTVRIEPPTTPFGNGYFSTIT